MGYFRTVLPAAEDGRSDVPYWWGRRRWTKQQRRTGYDGQAL
jgi:hypothetical protein